MDSTTQDQSDLRMPLLGLAAWAGGLLGLLAPWWWLAAFVAGNLGVAAIAFRRAARRARDPDDRAQRRHPRSEWTRWGLVAALILAAGGVGISAQLRSAQLSTGPVAALAADGAVGTLRLVLTSDPRVHQGDHGEFVTVRARTLTVSARGGRWRVDRPVLVIASTSWRGVELGATVETIARLRPGDDDLTAIASARGDPRVVAGAAVGLRGAEAVRASIRSAVSHRPADQRALVPALVVGDDAGLDPALQADFKTTGLTHLLAVSGTNLTLVVGFMLIVARWCRVRGRWLYVVGVVGIVGFVLLARTEPSVVRAAAMGAVALVGMGSNGRQRGTRALGVAVVALLLVDPWLAVSVGFALSVLATAGILFLGPGLRDALVRWLPRWVAEAVAVPLAAQLACTPVVAAISGQVSLVAVAANLLVAPAVAPATVLGLVGGLIGLVWAAAGQICGTVAGWCVGWIIAVARRGAGLPGAAVDWGTGAVALTLLVVLTVLVAVVAPKLLGQRWSGAFCCLVLTIALAGPALPTDWGIDRVLPDGLTPGWLRPWPPEGWLFVACDVGQGDALVLRTGADSAVVIDAGPDPVAVDRCLQRLGVSNVPLVVLTHFHADHVTGLPGILRGRRVGAIETTSVLDPPGGVAGVRTEAGDAGLQPMVAPTDSVRRVGQVTLQVLWPAPGARPDNANDSSVVLLAEVSGVRLLLTGDIEPPAQAALAARFPDLSVDVLKVPHHGSSYQDLPFLTSLGAELAVVSVGEDNDYGHPDVELIEELSAAGTTVRRTDRSGDLAVVRDGTEVAVVTRD